MTQEAIFKLAETTPFRIDQITEISQRFRLSEKYCSSILQIATRLGITYDMLYSCLMYAEINAIKKQ